MINISAMPLIYINIFICTIIIIIIVKITSTFMFFSIFVDLIPNFIKNFFVVILILGLANFCIFTLYPHLIPAGTDSAPYLFRFETEDDESKPIKSPNVPPKPLERRIYQDWFIEIVERTAK